MIVGFVKLCKKTHESKGKRDKKRIYKYIVLYI